MSQTSQIVIANQAGAPYRAAVNNMLSALNTAFSGTTPPPVSEAYMNWLDTSVTPNVLKRRNASDTAWETHPLQAIADAALPKADNLASLTDKAVARANLSVYSQAEVTSMLSGTQAAFSNLRASATGTSATITETVAEITLGDGSGGYKTLRNIALSGTLTTSGANGLDNSAPQIVTITVASPGVVTLNGHGFPTNAALVLATSGSLPTGLVAGTTYYVINPTTNTFQLSSTKSGAAINTSGTQSGAHTISSVLAASSWYSKWIVWNGTTAAHLFSSSSSAPVLPTGYTYKARTGWVYTDGSVNKYPLSFIQQGADVQYKVAAGSNVAGLPIMSSGVQGSTSTPTWVAVAVANFVPPTSSAIYVVAFHNVTAGGGYIVAPNNSYGNNVSTTNPPPMNSSLGATATSNQTARFILESSNIYYAGSSSGDGVACLGWEDNL